MKIVYSAGNRYGADQQLYRFYNAAKQNHDIKIAAYLKSSYSLINIDWTLDALRNFDSLPSPNSIASLFGHAGAPRVDVRKTEILLNEIDKFNPDLIICDFENILSHISITLNIPLWYCSPLHLMDGVEWKRKEILLKTPFVLTLNQLQKLPPASKKLIYSPFSSLEEIFTLKEGYQFVSPYYQGWNKKEIAIIPDPTRNLERIIQAVTFPERFVLLSGETDYLSDALFQKYSVAISPNPTDTESMLNARVCELLDLGYNLGMIEGLKYDAVNKLEETFQNKNEPLDLYITHQKLHEMVNEYACSL